MEANVSPKASQCDYEAASDINGPAGQKSSLKAVQSRTTKKAGQSQRDEGDRAEEIQMQNFIRDHMMNILRPVADHVHGLQAQIHHLNKTISNMDEKIDMNKAASEQGYESLVPLKGRFVPIEAKLEKIENTLALSARERSRLDADHEVTKANLREASESIITMDSITRGALQRMESLEASLSALRIEAKQASNDILKQSDKLFQLNELSEGLNNRHFDLVAQLTEYRRSSAETRQALREFMFDFGRSDSGVTATTERLSNRVKDLETTIADVQHSFLQQLESFKGLPPRIGHLECLLDVSADDGTVVDKVPVSLKNDMSFASRASKRRSGRIDVIMDSYSALAKSLEEQAERSSSMEQAITDLKLDVMTEKAHVHGCLGDIDRRAKMTSSNLESLEEAQQKHVANLTGITKTIESQALKQGALEEKASKLTEELETLSWEHKDSQNTIDSHAVLLTKSQTEADDTRRDLDTARAGLDFLAKELSAANGSMAALGTRLNSFGRSFQGLSKGFQETQKHVDHGEYGMLSSKTAVFSMLPELHQSSCLRSASKT